MDGVQKRDDGQAARWKGAGGRAWVDAQAVLDGVLKPLEDVLIEAAPVREGDRVLDVGCGTGGTTVAFARLLGPEGRCVGADISEAMIDAARARAEHEGSTAGFVLADAQEYAFEPAAFDAVVSRFGVMFFDDSVRAFANLRRAVRDGGELRFLVWRGIEENPFMTTAERAAAPLLPGIPARRPDEPGQFALADPDRVRRILEGSGWAGIDIRPVDADLTLPEAELIGYFTRLGLLGQVLPGADEPTRARVVETVRAAFEPFVEGPLVRFTAACWLVGARAQGAPGGPVRGSGAEPRTDSRP
ncbi:class I SAM-dependent methyltransferase [Kitasatospora sp. RG8]|uniref:class I SAM-dependent methyltransferase n=1 Tax=Kitasatospora sp. RG8 TaxID=2820815 RepID=UPI001AE057B7|nr:class I SAM-dependent methyltransferase [Kitasatospora sp. RG8]MBP0449270.1 class I SAM-dependent methyltransferase [Kitasatospora sp. RG8]